LLSASLLPLPSKVTKTPTATFCVKPGFATGAVFDEELPQIAPPIAPKLVEQSLLPPPQEAKKGITAKRQRARSVFIMG
jgi:hypothetical protein